LRWTCARFEAALRLARGSGLLCSPFSSICRKRAATHPRNETFLVALSELQEGRGDALLPQAAGVTPA
jgi:hypothetical protein